MPEEKQIKWYKVKNCHNYHAIALPSDGKTLCGRVYNAIEIMPYAKFKGFTDAFSLLDDKSISKYFKDRLCKKCCKKLEELRNSEEKN